MISNNILTTDENYHIFNKSIAGFVIFNDDYEYNRILKNIKYYQTEKHDFSLSRFLRLDKNNTKNHNKNPEVVKVIAYCIMPTHIHLILKQSKETGISIFVSNILNSYTRYFNLKHKRKGPLWEGRFKRVHVETDEQLLHLTRYIHLNPTTASLTTKPELWKYSSYVEYLNNNNHDKICDYSGLLDISTAEYKKFTEDRISYQKELAKIKNLIHD